MDMKALVDQLGGIKGVTGGELTPMTKREIDDLEKELQCSFPETYRTFLATYGASSFNGESPENKGDTHIC